MSNLSIMVIFVGLVFFMFGVFVGSMYKYEQASKDAWKRIKPLADKYNELISKYEKKLEGGK